MKITDVSNKKTVVCGFTCWHCRRVVSFGTAAEVVEISIKLRPGADRRERANRLRMARAELRHALAIRIASVTMNALS